MAPTAHHSQQPPGLAFLAGGGEMGERMRALEWSQTSLGAPETWPQSLKTIVRMMLDSRCAMWMLWGADLTFFCNDACLPTVGNKRDWVLGARADKVWEEIWPDIGPRIAQVLEHRQATGDEDHAFSYSPLHDDAMRIAGMLCVVSEASERVSGERLRSYMDSVTDGFYVLDSAMHFAFANSVVATRLGKTRDQLVGKRIWDVIPEAVGSESHVQLSRAMHKRSTVEYEVYFEPWQRWYRNKAYPTPDGGIAVYTKDITEERSAESLMERQNLQQREADQHKDEFLAMLAHELRNPLASIGNAGQILARLTHVVPDTEVPLTLLKRQTGQLTRLVDDLLDISRIARGRIQLDMQPLELGAVIEQAIENVQPIMQEKSHRVITVKHRVPLYVRGDLSRLVQSFSNLLHNAAKYTDTGGEIRVAVFDVDNDALVEVRDNGVGIAADLLPHVFDLFVQSERTLDRSQGGLGIGLSVVKRLIAMHGGSVTVASSGPGQGAAFAIRLPRVDPPVVAQPAVQRAAPTRRRILVVDDNVDAADSLVMLLQLDGHDVQAAYGATAAIQAVQRGQPQMVFLDIGLPEMDGYEVARRLRKLDFATPLRLIALTGYGQQEDVERSYAAGFNDHLVKPVSAQALEAILAGDL